MNASLDRYMIPIQDRHARLAERAPPARLRTTADPRWRRIIAATSLAARQVARRARRVLVISGPEPMPGATPAMAGRHPLPEAPSTVCR